MIFSVDSSTDNAEFSENFKILLFLENVVKGSIDHFGSKVLNELISDKVIDDEFVISQKLFNHVKNDFCFLDVISFGRILAILFVFGRNDALDEIGKNEHDPLGHVNLEHLVASNKFCDHFVNRVVKLNELLSFVVLVVKNRFLVSLRFEVFFHVEKQLKQQLTDTQVLTDVLLHF